MRLRSPPTRDGGGRDVHRVVRVGVVCVGVVLVGLDVLLPNLPMVDLHAVELDDVLPPHYVVYLLVELDDVLTPQPISPQLSHPSPSQTLSCT